ncbi:hypothetical protein [Streptomyces gardneri]|uniref:hypothetical protein n=1 Tax=Streptomyces gardneri TaxID=66892 RepID=UPI00369F7FF3
MNTTKKRTFSLVATAAVTLGIMTLAAPPASAAQTCREWSGNKACIDNSPGDGAQSWAWIWDGDADQRGVSLTVLFVNGDADTIYDTDGANNGATTGEWWYSSTGWNISGFVICERQNGQNTGCSPTYYV